MTRQDAIRQANVTKHVDHPAYIRTAFDEAHGYGTLDYFSDGFRELYFLLAEDRFTPAQIVRAYELLWEVDTWRGGPPFYFPRGAR